MGTIRKHLSNRNNHGPHGGILIDMELVYKEIDSGKTVQEVADELGVHKATLYRRHNKYQKELEVMEKRNINLDAEEVLPMN